VLLGVPEEVPSSKLAIQSLGENSIKLIKNSMNSMSSRDHQLMPRTQPSQSYILDLSAESSSLAHSYAYLPQLNGQHRGPGELGDQRSSFFTNEPRHYQNNPLISKFSKYNFLSEVPDFTNYLNTSNSSLVLYH
jgi:hypothetical protein